MDDSGSVKGVILTVEDEAGSVGWDPGPCLLLPLANTPLVERVLGEYARAGIRETLISAGRDTREIASLCGDGARWDMSLTYRDPPDGQGCIEKSHYERVRELAEFTKNAPFLVTPGPILLESKVYGSLIQSYSETHPRGIRAGRHVGNVGSVGSAGSTPGNAHESTGIYLMTPHVYDALISENAGDDTPDNLFDAALEELARRGETVLVLDLDNRPYGVRSPEAYLESNERILASFGEETTLPEIMDDNFSSPNLVLRQPACVDATAELERCRIGPGVCIGPDVRIGHGAAIEHSVIMEGADIGDGASISHAVIGRNASIENRSVVHGRANRVRVVRSKWIPPACATR